MSDAPPASAFLGFFPFISPRRANQQLLPSSLGPSVAPTRDRPPLPSRVLHPRPADLLTGARGGAAFLPRPYPDPPASFPTRGRPSPLLPTPLRLPAPPPHRIQGQRVTRRRGRRCGQRVAGGGVDSVPQRRRRLAEVRWRGRQSPSPTAESRSRPHRRSWPSSGRWWSRHGGTGVRQKKKKRSCLGHIDCKSPSTSIHN
jgi:hypothetical protein